MLTKGACTVRDMLHNGVAQRVGNKSTSNKCATFRGEPQGAVWKFNGPSQAEISARAGEYTKAESDNEDEPAESAACK